MPGNRIVDHSAGAAAGWGLFVNEPWLPAFILALCLRYLYGAVARASLQ